jgi:hypothetical protein
MEWLKIYKWKKKLNGGNRYIKQKEIVIARANGHI